MIGIFLCFGLVEFLGSSRFCQGIKPQYEGRVFARVLGVDYIQRSKAIRCYITHVKLKICTTLV